MTRRVWVLALALGLGGWQQDAAWAQDLSWRPATPQPSAPTTTPPPPAKVRAAGSVLPRASLGRPVAPAEMSDYVMGRAPRQFPAAYRTSADVEPPASPYYPAGRGGVAPIAVVPPPGAVIAASAPHLPATRLLMPPAGQPMEDPAGGDTYQGDQFAQDRPPTPRLGQQARQPAPRPVFEPYSTQAERPAAPIRRVGGGGDAGGVVMPAGPFPPAPKATSLPGLVNWVGTYPVTPPEPLPMAHQPMADVGAPTAASSPTRWYLAGEYLLWWTKRANAPALVTTGSPDELPLSGALGQPSTVVLNNGQVERQPRSGGRFFAGYYLDDCGDKAIEIGGFFLSSPSNDFRVSSAQNPVLVRPFFAVNTAAATATTPSFPREFGEIVAFPGVSTGSVSVQSPSNLWGAEVNYLCKWCCGCDYRVNWLVGGRYLNLSEQLVITEDIQFAQNPDPRFNVPRELFGARVLVQDRFITRNQFYGAQVGLDGAYQFGRWSIDGRAKVALGTTRQVLDVTGTQSFPPGVVVTDIRPGGALALASNSGHFTRDRFTVVPEVGVSVGYWLTENLRASVGYNFLFWSSVIRPADQIDRGLDITQIPNFGRFPPGTQRVEPARPAVLFKDSTYWAQGLTFGLELRF